MKRIITSLLLVLMIISSSWAVDAQTRLPIYGWGYSNTGYTSEIGVYAREYAEYEYAAGYMWGFSNLAAFVASGYALNAYVSYVGYGATSMGVKSVRRIYNITVTDGSYGVTTVSGLGTTFYVSGGQVMYISG